MKIDNYLLYVKWSDIENKKHVVGVLAYIDGEYFLKGKRIGDINKKLLGNTFSGIPPHRDTQLHKSKELFEFFANRISPEARKNPEDIYKELLEKKGKSHIDSFTVEQIAKKEDKEKVEKALKELIKVLNKKIENPEEIK